jgi:hypothetical protein
MLSRAKTTLVAICFLALFGFLAFQVGIASTYSQRHRSDHAIVVANEPQNMFERFWDWTTDDPVAFFTFVLSVSTIGLWLVTWRSGVRQSREMKASIKAATDGVGAALASNQIAVYNAEQRLRAYVSALEVNLRLQRRANMVGAHQVINGPVHTYSVSVVLKNGGQTPTRNLTTNFSALRFIGAMPEEFDFPDSGITAHGLIGPSGTLLTPEINFDATEFERTDANFHWYIWGWAEYDDVFSGTTRHRTEFCFEAKPTRDPHTNEIYVGFPMHKRFNAADWDTLRPYDGHENRYG